jgi:hypothetical protein
MIGHDMGRFLEPEGRKLAENLSFVRDAAGQHNIESRDSVSGYDE